jgi:hypothetical protein
MTTKQDLIKELQDLAEDNPSKNITREFYRKETGNYDSVWQPIFGNFLEFKRAAGLEVTKVQSQVISNVAKHASRDKLREYSLHKTQWEGKYNKPAGNRFQTILAGSDIHAKLADNFWVRTFIDTAKRVQPQKIVLVGDIFDFPNFSKYTQDPRTFDVVGEINWVHNFLERLREASPDSEITLIEGNHEVRLAKYIGEAAPNILPLLSDVHGLTVERLIGLDKYEVNYVARANLAVFNETEINKELAKNYFIAYDTVLFHHFPGCKNWGMNAQSGHHHSLKVNVSFNLNRGPVTWVQPGCGHVRNASYSGSANGWTNGYCLWHVDTEKKLAQPEIIDVTNTHAVIAGKYYLREENEILNLGLSK